jgi:hypothetical protein
VQAERVRAAAHEEHQDARGGDQSACEPGCHTGHKDNRNCARALGRLGVAGRGTGQRESPSRPSRFMSNPT